MSEYWKSTPKYWCKYCSTYVKDTPLEKTNHEASPRHQGNLKKSLRDLHRNNERAEREKQYAKAEAARLNGTGLGAAQPQINGDGRFKTAVNFTKTTARNASVDDRKRQVAQLAALGVAVPDGFRGENAMVGDWQVTAQKITRDNNLKKEEDLEVKPGLNLGTRKRKTEERDEVEEFLKSEEGQNHPRYGRTRLLSDDDDELNALLNSTAASVRSSDIRVKQEVKKEAIDGENLVPNEEPIPEAATVRVKEEPDEDGLTGAAPATTASGIDPRTSSDNVGSIFKKRKRPPMKK